MPASDISRVTLRSREEFEAIGVNRRRVGYEDLIAQLHRDDEAWEHPGFCLACEKPSPFRLDWVTPAGELPNYRERMVCPSCGLNNRQRFVAGLLRDGTSDDTSVFFYEQITFFFAWATAVLPGRITGSEYMGHGRTSGDVVGGVRHEDATALSFPDDTFDVLVSQDVFEHVPDIEASLAEASRVLRPTGSMWFSIPFHAKRDETVRRAELDGEQVVELLPAEYHGNPVDAEAGSLVFYDHGWDILEKCRAAGFADAYVVGYWSALCGHIGGGLQFVLGARNG